MKTNCTKPSIAVASCMSAGSIIIIITIVIGLLSSTGQALAQADFGLNLRWLNDLGYGATSISEPLPSDWRSRFIPSSPNGMETGSSRGSLCLDSGLALEPSLTWQSKKGHEWELGIPTFYTLSILGLDNFAGPQKRIGETTVKWWDEVTLQSIQFEKTGPSIGLSLRRDQWRVQYALQPYRTVLQDFEGIDHYGAPNESKLLRERSLDSSLSHRFDLGYEFERPGFGVGAFYERARDKVWFVGISLTYTFQFFKR